MVAAAREDHVAADADEAEGPRQLDEQARAASPRCCKGQMVGETSCWDWHDFMCARYNNAVSTSFKHQASMFQSYHLGRLLGTGVLSSLGRWSGSGGHFDACLGVGTK